MELINTLTRADQQWIMRQLSQSLGQATVTSLPTQAPLEEALELYLVDQCSLGRAAELAGVTRWDIIDVLKNPSLRFITKRNDELLR